MEVAALVRHLGRVGIEARPSFPPQSRLFNLPPGAPTTARISGEILCLPTGASMPLEWADTVVEHLVEARRLAGKDWS